jgi:hypothetical protein
MRLLTFVRRRTPAKTDSTGLLWWRVSGKTSRRALTATYRDAALTFVGWVVD